MDESNFLVMIAQAKTEPWESIWKEGQNPTWVNRYCQTFTIINVSGQAMGTALTAIDSIHEKIRYKSFLGKWQGRLDYAFVPLLRRELPGLIKIQESTIQELQVQTNSSYIFSGRRLLAQIKWFLENTDKEYLILTTTSSLWNLKSLQSFLPKFGLDNPYYAGHVLGDYPNQFISGAGQVINRTCASLIMKNLKHFPYRMLNDIALGTLLRKVGVTMVNIPWLWIQSLNELENTPDRSFNGKFHFRCKSSSFPRQDIRIMRAIHERLVSLQSQGKIDY